MVEFMVEFTREALISIYTVFMYMYMYYVTYHPYFSRLGTYVSVALPIA